MDHILDHWTFDEQEKKRLEFYRDFFRLDELRAFTQLLYEHDIPFSAEKPEVLIDANIVGTGMLPSYILRLFPEDFPKANALLAEQMAGLDASQLQEHYLNQMDNAELLRIIDQPDAWSVEDGVVAKLLLRHRGVHLSDAEIQASRSKRLHQIRQGRSGKPLWMVFYFICSVLGAVFALVFFLAGIGMGYYYAYGVSVDPDGNRYFEFDATTRYYGKVLLYGGIIVAIATAIWLYSGLFQSPGL